MKKTLKRILSLALATIMTLMLFVVGYAEDEESSKVTLSIMSSNVAGLPIPSKFSKDGKVVPDDTKMLASMINESGCDIVCVQEDFQYHSLFAKQMTNYPYQSYTSGGIPVGDGLNVFSKYPIYNIDRVTWEEACGILDKGNDALTPKGFIKFTVDVNGVLVDVYDIHADAYGGEENEHARYAQFLQITKYINENSVGMPVMITGDFNCTFHSDYLSGLYDIFIKSEGFEDSWVNIKNDGNYFRGDDASQLISDWFAKYNNCYWGCWDSVERVLYRDDSGSVIAPVSFEYETYFEPGTTRSLSDHAMMIADMEIDTTNYVRPDVELNAPTDSSFFAKIFHTIKMVNKCLSLLVPEFLKKLIAGEIF